MLDLSEPIQIYQSPGKGRRRQLFVCEWRALGSASFLETLRIASLPRGVFLVEAVHPISARVTARKVLRDRIVPSRQFIFDIRAASPDELAQVGRALAHVHPLRAPASADKTFTDGSPSADSTCKT